MEPVQMLNDVGVVKMKLDNQQQLKSVRKRKNFQLLVSVLLPLASVLYATLANAESCRQQIFADALQINHGSGNIAFAFNAQVLENPDNTLTAPQVQRDPNANKTTCPTANCSATGGSTPAQQLESFRFTVTNLDYTVPHTATGILGDGGQRDYRLVNAEGNTTLSIKQEGHTLSDHYRIDTLNLGFQARLNLLPGSYWIKQLNMEAEASINVVGPGTVKLYVYNGFYPGWMSRFNVSELGDPLDSNQLVVIAYSGAQLNTGLFSGFFYSPSAVQLGNQYSLHGALNASAIQLQNDAKVSFRAPGSNTNLGQLCSGDIGPDSDNDGVQDDLDLCNATPSDEMPDAQGCAPSQKDSDLDLVNDKLDQCPNTTSGAFVDQYGCTPGEMPNCREQLFADGAQVHNGQGKIQFGHNAYIAGNPDRILNATQVLSDSGATLLSCQSGHCLPSGNPVPQHQLQAYQYSTDTNGYHIPYYGSGQLATNGRRNYGFVNVDTGGTLNVDGNGHNPEQPYHLKSLSLQYMSVWNARPGTYWIESFSMGTKAKINVIGAGTVRIYAKNTVSLNGEIRINHSSSGPQKPDQFVLVSYDGISTGDGFISGYLFAQANVSLGYQLQLQGALVAGNVVTNSATKITYLAPKGPTDLGQICPADILDSDGDNVLDRYDLCPDTNLGAPVNSNGCAPNQLDSDNDGLNDQVELDDGTDPNDPDSDNDGVNDFDEKQDGTNPLNPDSDGDSLNDSQEKADGTNPLNADSDSDGVNDGIEKTDGTNPLSADTDSDGVNDGVEKADGTNPLNADSDSDGVNDGIEKADGTNPLNADSDLDGVNDGTEKADGTNPLNADSDSDGVSDGIEKTDGTNPLSADTDSDGVSDGVEKVDGTNPLNADSDSDGVNDGAEKADGTNPLNADSDADGVNDGVEKADGTNPLNADSDSDGVSDGIEKTDGTNPLNADSDSDGVNDGVEKTDGTNPLNADSDSDGVNDGTEKADGTDPLNPDSDSDGVNDGIEKADSTNPSNPDSDADGINDGTEKADGTNPLNADSDSDGVSDSEEKAGGTNPLNEDSDLDGIQDGADRFPLDPTESLDLDNDGIGDNSDDDRDGDGFSNEVEDQRGTNPSDPNDYPELNAPQLGLGIPDSQVVVEDLITVSGTIQDESAVTVVVRNSLLPLTNFTADISGNNWTAQIPLEVGTNLLTVRAEDQYFNVAQKTAIVEREIPSGTYGLTVHSPTNGSQTTNATLVVRGSVSSEYPALNITVTVAGVPTTVRPTGDVTEFTYESQEITLTEGLNVLPIQAAFAYAGGQTEQTQRSLYITYAPEQEATPQPRLTILSPTNGAYINEASFYLVGEAQSFSGAAILSINGDPVALENGQTQAGTFKELISFPGSADNLKVNIYLRDDLGQTASTALQFFRDGQAPVITLDNPLQLLPAENLVQERPYTLSGKVADANLASFQINGQAIALEPTANANEYAFRTQINPTGGQASQVNLQAVDLSGNTTVQSYIIRLDSAVTLTMVLPPPSTTLINSGNPIPVQVVAKVAGSASGTSVRAIVLDSSGTQIAHSGLTLDGSYLLGEITLPANAGQYTIEVQVIADSTLLTKATRAITVEDAQDVELSLQSLTPANGAVDVEPNQPVTLSFSKAIDPSLLQININETAHGNTYIRKEGESQDAVVNEGYQLQRVDREYAPVPGGLGALPGNRLFTFYPSQWLAYSADVYVEVIYDGQEMIRSHFKTRALPTFVDGGVLDQFGQPVAGVTVTLPELKRSAVTNSAGAFTFGYGDAASQQLPAGRHTLVTNPDMAVAGFGTLSQTVTINSGVRNTLGVLRLPALNQQDAFTPVSGGTLVILGKGDLQLDFSNAKLLFDNDRSTGLMQAQFNELQQLSQRTDPDFIGLWYFGLQPQGVKVEGDFTFKLRIPAYQDNVDYLGPDGTYQLILATDPDSDTIVPLGVGQRQGDHIISLRHQITTLTYLGVVPVPDHYQAVIEQYRNGELSLSALVVRLRSDLQRIRSGEYQIPGL